jgi:hypothetical protein
MNENNVTVLSPQQQSGALLDMDSSGASEMAIRLGEMTTKLDLVQKFFKQVMVKDLDYGIIPGTDKPTLYKPGAEKLCELYGFAPIVKAKNDTRDFKTGYYLSEIIMKMYTVRPVQSLLKVLAKQAAMKVNIDTVGCMKVMFQKA